MQDLHDFLEPVKMHEINDDKSYTDGQMAKHISIFESDLPDLSNIDIVIAGISETRGNGFAYKPDDAADIIRRHFYQLHCWHPEVTISDIGNIKPGASINDSYAAVKTVLSELLKLNTTTILIGGSHDITTAQCNAYDDMQKQLEVTCIDAMIDLKGQSQVRSENFLLEMLTKEPNLVKHYNHIGFQSYFVHPRMLETMDKLRFDCYRAGLVKEDIEAMEPVIRNTNLLSIDVSAIKNSDAPSNYDCPNGISGVEACMLTRYAGMSNSLSSMGIYGYFPVNDLNELTAKQISQMLWYFIDGKSRSKQEARMEDRHHFNEYHTAFAEIETIFLQSKKTNRWWMQMPDKKFIACSHNDYIKASFNEIPERWLRVQERN